MNGKGWFPKPNRYALAIVASMVVIAGGMFSCIALAMAAGPDSGVAICCIVLCFGLISLIPISALWPARGVEWSRDNTISFREMFSELFARKQKEPKPLKPWKRKPTSFQSTPHGHEYVTTFIPEKRDPYDEPSPVES